MDVIKKKRSNCGVFEMKEKNQITQFFQRRSCSLHIHQKALQSCCVKFIILDQSPSQGLMIISVYIEII